MNFRQFQLGASLIIVTAVFVCGAMSHGQSLPSSASRGSEATILISALDRNQNPVEIRAEDSVVTEDGKPTQISHFEKTADGAITIAVVIDVSISEEQTLNAQKSAAKSFVNTVVRPDRDVVAVATLTNTVHVQQQPTDDLDSIRAAIDGVKSAVPIGYRGRGVVIGPTVRGTAPSLVGTSAIWDAIVKICEGSRFSSDKTRRPAILLFTDGQDTASKAKLPQAIESAIRKNMTVYSIGIGDDKYDGVNKNDLRKLSEETGGKAYFPKKTTDLSREFEEIGKTLRNYYVLNYTPAAIKPNSKLKITFTDPKTKDVQLLYKRVAAH